MPPEGDGHNSFDVLTISPRPSGIRCSLRGHHGGWRAGFYRLPQHGLGVYLWRVRGTTANVLIGLMSAVVDNIPVMFAVLTMNPDMPECSGCW